MSSGVKWLSMAVLCFLAAGNLDTYIESKLKGGKQNLSTWLNLWAVFICLIPALCYMIK